MFCVSGKMLEFQYALHFSGSIQHFQFKTPCVIIVQQENAGNRIFKYINKKLDEKSSVPFAFFFFFFWKSFPFQYLFPFAVFDRNWKWNDCQISSSIFELPYLFSPIISQLCKDFFFLDSKAVHEPPGPDRLNVLDVSENDGMMEYTLQLRNRKKNEVGDKMCWAKWNANARNKSKARGIVASMSIFLWLLLDCKSIQ